MTEHANPQTGDPDELLGLDQASALLGVPVEQVKAMVDQGLISSIEDEGGLGFRRGELLAAREAGG